MKSTRWNEMLQMAPTLMEHGRRHRPKKKAGPTRNHLNISSGFIAPLWLGNPSCSISITTSPSWMTSNHFQMGMRRTRRARRARRVARPPPVDHDRRPVLTHRMTPTGLNNPRNWSERHKSNIATVCTLWTKKNRKRNLNREREREKEREKERGKWLKQKKDAERINSRGPVAIAARSPTSGNLQTPSHMEPFHWFSAAHQSRAIKNPQSHSVSVCVCL